MAKLLPVHMELDMDTESIDSDMQHALDLGVSDMLNPLKDATDVNVTDEQSNVECESAANVTAGEESDLSDDEVVSQEGE